MAKKSNPQKHKGNWEVIVFNDDTYKWEVIAETATADEGFLFMELNLKNQTRAMRRKKEDVK